MENKTSLAEKLSAFKQKARVKLNAFAERINTPFVQRVGNKVISKKHLYPSFAFPVLLLMIVYAALGFWPVGDRCMLTLDMSAQYIFYFEQIRDVLAKQFEIDAETITMDTSLIDDIGADSLDVVELIMSLEDNFSISISDEEAAELHTVRRIVEYLEKLQ